MTDEGRLRQILINLISNSLKYTKVGSVEVEATFDHGSFTINVRDTGVGIESHRIEGLFSGFSNVSRQLNMHGVGLGLTICKNLTEALGGIISVQSVLGVGSKFTVVLPCIPLSLRGITRTTTRKSDLKK